MIPGIRNRYPRVFRGVLELVEPKRAASATRKLTVQYPGLANDAGRPSWPPLIFVPGGQPRTGERGAGTIAHICYFDAPGIDHRWH